MPRLVLRLVSVVVLSATLVAGAQAQETGGPYIDFETAPPAAPYTMETSASLLFLKPGGGNLDYGLMASPLPVPTPNWEYLSVRPDYTPAFNVGLGFLLANGCNDVQLAWTHLSTSDDASAVADPTDQFVGPPYEIGPDAGLFRFANATAEFDFDSVTLDIGQLVNSDGPFQFRFFGGLQLARIDSDLSARFASEDGLITNAYSNQSQFTGVGPRLGVKAQTSRGGFDLMGEVACSALIGTMKSHLDFSATTPELAILGIPSPNNQALTSPDATGVIASIESRLGTGYTLPSRGYGRIRLEAGYQVAVYMNAINQYSLSEVVTPPVDQSVGIYLRTASPTKNDFTAHGPYLTGTWTY